MTPLPTSTILQQGAYQLVGVVGVGGFGITYRALDVAGEREVAIKECVPAGCAREGAQVLAADFWSHSHFEAFKNRLRSQAQRLQKVSHPNLANVFDFFEENGTVYLVMEWVQGPTLLDLIERDAVQPEDALEWISKLSSVLEALHQHGLLHLDVKPENVILREGEPVLLDFDLVQPLGEADHSTRPLALATRCGTPGYAPLEQYAQTVNLSPATDIYALGATFYHLLLGRAPLSSVDRAAGALLSDAQHVSFEITPQWSKAIEQALELQPDKRPQTAELWTSLLHETPEPDEEEDYAPVTVAPQLMTHGTGFHRVVLTTRTPVFPKRCVCCQDKPDQTWVLNSPSGRYELPLCEACHRHQAAARASGMVTFWGTILSLALAGLVVWASFITSSLFPLLLGPFCIVINFAALSYGALKSSRAEEMLKNSCCDLSEPANYNFNGRVHIFRFKNPVFASDFKKKNADFVV